MNERRIGIIEFPFDLIATALQLPAGIKVTSANLPFEREVLQLKVEGDGLPEKCIVCEGYTATVIRPWYRETHLLGGSIIVQFERLT